MQVSFFKTLLIAAIYCGLFSLDSIAMADEAQPATVGKPIRVAVLTGGHPFNEKEFPKLFEGYSDIDAKQIAVKEGGEIFDDVKNWPYDVIVFYIYDRKITEEQKQNLLKLLDKGVGAVVLHHANYAYNNWPGFSEISGVTWYEKPEEKDGVKHEASGWKGKVKYSIHIVDPEYPITRGMKDFKIQDETYCRTSIAADAHPLLTTEEKTSDKIVGWTRTFKNAKVCYLQAGHNETAYRNPSYRALVANAIRWTANCLPEKNEESTVEKKNK
jgi:uncharacterized protein